MANGMYKGGGWRKNIRLYDTKGENEDGTMTQKAIKEALANAGIETITQAEYDAITPEVGTVYNIYEEISV